MKRILKFICLALTVLVMASCEREKEFSGYVVGKHHEPALTYPYYDVTLRMIRTRYVPEQWVVYIADSCRVRRLNVHQTTFDAVELGENVRITAQETN